MMQTFSNLKVNSVINYFEHFKIGQRYIIIMEYLGENWIDLYDFIEIYGPVKEQTSRKIFKKVVKVISDMHVLGFSHNDVKGKQIVIDT
jgi:serine/threonine protein kinase